MCIRSECGQVGGFLLRPKLASSTFQIVLVFGERKGVIGGVCSVRTVTLPAALSTRTAEEQEILGICSCDIFSLLSKCEHVPSLLQSLQIQRKFEGLHSRRLELSICSMQSMEWENISLLMQPGDEAQVWLVFRREKFNVRAKTSGSVIVNFRAKNLRMGFRQRVKCLLCCGVASNRLMCSQELACIRFLEDTNVYACENECTDDISTEQVQTDIKEFLPTKSRRFFACSGEGNRIRRLIESTRSGKKCENYMFTGVDVWSECTACNAS